MRIIPRAEWGARHDNGFGPRALPATEVWLHHSVTIAPDLVQPFDDDYDAIRTLEQIGENRFGKGISYTWCITPAGLIFEGHSVDRVGSHTANHNTIACAICFVGNYDNQPPTLGQLRAAAWLLQVAHANRWIDAARIDGGHRDLKQTACPGAHAYAAIPTINQLAAGGPVTEEEGDMQALEPVISPVTGKSIGAFKDVTFYTNLYANEIPAIKAMVTELIATAHDDLDADAVLARVDTAVREATERAIASTVLPALRAVLDEALGDDNADQADAIVTELAGRLRPAA